MLGMITEPMKGAAVQHAYDRSDMQPKSIAACTNTIISKKTEAPAKRQCAKQCRATVHTAKGSKSTLGKYRHSQGSRYHSAANSILKELHDRSVR